MGVDSVFIAENIAGATIETFRADLVAGAYPDKKAREWTRSDDAWGGAWELEDCDTAYHYVEFGTRGETAYVVIHSGARLRWYYDEEPGIHAAIIAYLRRVCGGRVWLVGDSGWDDLAAWSPDDDASCGS